MKFKYFFLFLLVMIGCAVEKQTKRQAELVVTYNDKVVHRASPVYSNLDKLDKELRSNKTKRIIFGAYWCPPCKNLYKAIEQGGWMDDVVILDLEQPWVAELYVSTGINTVPAMIVLDSKNDPVAIQQGASNIIMYLVINVP